MVACVVSSTHRGVDVATILTASLIWNRTAHLLYMAHSWNKWPQHMSRFRRISAFSIWVVLLRSWQRSPHISSYRYKVSMYIFSQSVRSKNRTVFLGFSFVSNAPCYCKDFTYVVENVLIFRWLTTADRAYANEISAVENHFHIVLYVGRVKYVLSLRSTRESRSYYSAV